MVITCIGKVSKYVSVESIKKTNVMEGITVTLEFSIFPVLLEVYFVVHGMLMGKRRPRTVLRG